MPFSLATLRPGAGVDARHLSGEVAVLACCRRRECHIGVVHPRHVGARHVGTRQIRVEQECVRQIRVRQIRVRQIHPCHAGTAPDWVWGQVGSCQVRARQVRVTNVYLNHLGIRQVRTRQVHELQGGVGQVCWSESDVSEARRWIHCHVAHVGTREIDIRETPTAEVNSTCHATRRDSGCVVVSEVNAGGIDVLPHGHRELQAVAEEPTNDPLQLAP